MDEWDSVPNYACFTQFRFLLQSQLFFPPVLLPAKQSESLSNICKDSLFYSCFSIILLVCIYICVCMHDKGGAEAQIWLRWSKAPKWKIMCFTPIQLSSHKTTISVISQAPVSVQEQQQCQQWVSAPYKLTLGGWRWLFIPVHAYYLCLPSCTSIIYRNEPKPYKGSCRGRWKNITHIQHPQTSKGNYRFLRDWNQQCLMKNFSHTGY